MSLVPPSAPGQAPKLFSCLQCLKSFSRVENLRRHAAAHEAGKYPCVVCGKTFTRSDLLKRHRRNHEKQDSLPAEARPHVQQQEFPHPTGEEESTSETSLPVPGLSEGIDGYGLINSIQNVQFDLPNDIFMSNDNISGLNLGSFDGDIAWTLDFAYSHPFVDAFPDEYLTPSSVNLPAMEQDAAIEIADDDNIREWPDRISRPASPKGHRTQRPPRRNIDWSATIAEHQLLEARTQPRDAFVVTTDEALRESLINLLNLPYVESGKEGFPVASFPPCEVMDHFFLLYFRHIHERFPVLHLPTFSLSKESPLLLIAMLLAGSSHSKANQAIFGKVFYKHCQLALTRSMEANDRYLRSVDNIFGLLLICLVGTWSGNRDSYEFSEGFRGVLVTTSRRCRLLDCRPNPSEGEKYKNCRVLDQMWYSWVEVEKRKRLGLAIYIYDCQYPALFNNQPYVSKGETANSVLPCPQEYWDAKTSDTWKMLIGPANMPPSTFYIHALNSCLLPLDVSCAQRINDFGRIVLLYALHGHIFEWRQAITMLNPNGFANMYGGKIVDIGDGLQLRKEWLIDSLNSWHLHYAGQCNDPTILLMYHLGFVSLDVSLSDLHLAAGRSGNRAEGEIAKQSLRTWAKSEVALTTMAHVRKGFDITYSLLDSGAVSKGSFEIIMSLFTGGLVSWAYLQFHPSEPPDCSVEDIRRAGVALQRMASWRISSLFGAILKDIEETLR